MNDKDLTQDLPINRLIIIGNGFDLAHGLKSSYKDFIYDYSYNVLQNLLTTRYYNDKLLRIKLLDEDFNDLNEFKNLPKEAAFKKLIDIYNNNQDIFELSTGFVKDIFSQVENKNWVDIETTYFKFLKSYKDELNEVKRLNAELSFIRNKLLEYLTNELNKFNLSICNKLEEQFYQKILGREINSKFKRKYDYVPKSLCIINFNYTDLVFRLCKNTNLPQLTYIPIHGQLETREGFFQEPIFGYGDELDRDYLEFENQENNNVFEHIKSFKYLQSDSYRKLLDFIENSFYQVSIFGHSCGLSDRTLLNTIFEHENCISIKPFYYKWEDGDDYEQKSFAISRHFKSKQELRARVVNKKYCEPMAQPISKDKTT